MEDIHTTDTTIATHPEYAGFWRRFAAYLIDYSILHIVFLPFTLLFLRNSGLWALLDISRKMPEGSSDMITLISPDYAILLQNIFKEISYFVLLEIVFWLLYYSLWESSRLQATPGKLATGIKVMNIHGQRISFIRAIGRNFCKLFSGIIFMIGYIMAGFTERKQALHDIITECVIIRSETVTEPAQVYTYAGFWLRLVAYILDSILLYILLSPINFLFRPSALKDPLRAFLHCMRHPDAPLPNINDIILLISISTLGALITFFYFASWESSRYQATPGKLAIGIKVIDLNGQRLSFWRASGRYIAKIISSLTMLIGYMMAGWTKHKQALHDELCHCLVIKSNQ